MKADAKDNKLKVKGTQRLSGVSAMFMFVCIGNKLVINYIQTVE